MEHEPQATGSSPSPTKPTPEQRWRYKVARFSEKAGDEFDRIGNGDSESPVVRNHASSFREVAARHRKLSVDLLDGLAREGVDLAALHNDTSNEPAGFIDTDDSLSFDPRRSVLRLEDQIKNYPRQ